MIDHLIEFIARLHLLILHFPISLVTLVASLELLRLSHIKLSRRSASKIYRPLPAYAVIFIIAALSTLLTTIAGLLLGDGYSSKIDTHKLLGIVAAILTLTTLIPLTIALAKSSFKASIIYLACLLSSAGLISAAAHFGGELTHGEGFITDPLKSILNLSSKPQSTTPSSNSAQQTVPPDINISQAAFDEFNTMILPIFEQSCIECHGPVKDKGDLRLDTIEFTLDKDIFIVDQEDPANSELLFRIELDPADEDAMPPLDEAEPLTQEQIHTIKIWLESLAR